MSRFDSALTAFNPNDTRISPRNISQVRLLYTFELDNPYGRGAPVVDDGLVFEESYSLDGPKGTLEAFSAGCRTNGCQPLWRAVIGQYAGGSVAVADGLVFAGGDDQARAATERLFAFPEHCRRDSGTCRPLWYADLHGPGELDRSPTVSDGVVYVAGGAPFHSYLSAFPVSCHVSPGGSCPPLWRGLLDVGPDGPVAVADGFAYVTDYDGYLYAFRTTCSTTNRICDGVWFGYTNQLGPIGVAVSDGRVFVGSQDDNVYAFKAGGCGIPRSTCPPLWVGATHGNVRSQPAIAYGQVFVASDDGRYYAFPEDCSGQCRPAWTANFAGNDSYYASPFVAHGLVYFSNSDGGSTRAILAFGVHCATNGASCRPIRTITAPTYYLFEGPSLANGQLYATAGPEAGPGQVYVFGTPTNHAQP
jgi:outer membrane protein assembly factor BamB